MMRSTLRGGGFGNDSFSISIGRDQTIRERRRPKGHDLLLALIEMESRRQRPEAIQHVGIHPGPDGKVLNGDSQVVARRQPCESEAAIAS
jgi:hypothetical protein